MLIVFIDTDVIISSLLSPKGISFYLLNQNIYAHISTISLPEIKKVMKRLKIDPNTLKTLIQSRLKTVDMNQSLAEIQQTYATYVSDRDDAHILAGAVVAKAQFLITYNTKHFHREKIKDQFKLLIMTPALFLQYLRSLQ